MTEIFYKEEYSEDIRFYTWFFPGAPRSPFAFVKEGKNTMTHDTVHPSRTDGSPQVMMNKQLIYNV